MPSETPYYSYYVSKRSLYRKPIAKTTSKDGFKKREVHKILLKAEIHLLFKKFFFYLFKIFLKILNKKKKKKKKNKKKLFLRLEYLLGMAISNWLYSQFEIAKI